MERHPRSNENPGGSAAGPPHRDASNNLRSIPISVPWHASMPFIPTSPPTGRQKKPGLQRSNGQSCTPPTNWTNILYQIAFHTTAPLTLTSTCRCPESPGYGSPLNSPVDLSFDSLLQLMLLSLWCKGRLGKSERLEKGAGRLGDSSVDRLGSLALGNRCHNGVQWPLPRRL